MILIPGLSVDCIKRAEPSLDEPSSLDRLRKPRMYHDSSVTVAGGQF